MIYHLVAVTWPKLGATHSSQSADVPLGRQIEVASLTGAFQVWYTILVAVIWVPLAVIRAHDFLQGLINSVLFAIVTIIGLSARGYALWHTVGTLLRV